MDIVKAGRHFAKVPQAIIDWDSEPAGSFGRRREKANSCDVGSRAANQRRASRASSVQGSVLGEHDIGCGRVKAEIDLLKFRSRY
jgi:hypothetical protein